MKHTRNTHTLVGIDGKGSVVKGIMSFIINSLKISIRFVVEAVPDVIIEGIWLYQQIYERIDSLYKSGFNIVAEKFGNYSTNVNTFNLLKKYPSKTGAHENFLKVPSQLKKKDFPFFLTLCIYLKVLETIYTMQEYIFLLNLN